MLINMNASLPQCQQALRNCLCNIWICFSWNQADTASCYNRKKCFCFVTIFYCHLVCPPYKDKHNVICTCYLKWVWSLYSKKIKKSADCKVWLHWTGQGRQLANQNCENNLPCTYKLLLRKGLGRDRTVLPHPSSWRVTEWQHYQK